MPLEFEKTYPLLRVYFNSKSDYPNVWSLDDGDQTNEMNVPMIIGQGVHRYEYNGEKANAQCPVAWVEYRGARIHRIDDTEEIFIENSSEY
jgi:hypothetical protein